MIAIISDIHGNYVALKAVLKAIDTMGISEIVCLGDVVGYYSQVNECCDVLRERNVPCAMGNHDWYLVSNTQCKRSNSVNDCLAYQHKVISAENRAWICSFLPIIQRDGLSAVHGGWENPIDEYLVPTEEYFSQIKGKYFASGHTHVQRIEKYANCVYCNPGSVGQPRDGDAKAAFAVFDGQRFHAFRIPYEIDKVGELMNAAGFNPYYYGCLRDASEHLHR